jgi:hypothetical protein
MWMVNELIRTKSEIILEADAFADVPAIETLTITRNDPTPRHRPMIPSTFIVSSPIGERHRRDRRSDVTAFDESVVPPPTSASDLTAINSVPPTPSTSAPATTTGITQKLAIDKVIEAPTPRRSRRLQSGRRGVRR